MEKNPVVTKKCFNEIYEHYRKDEPDNDDFSRNILGKLLFGHFIATNELLSKDDVHTTFSLLSFDTLYKAYLAWFVGLTRKRRLRKLRLKKRVEYELKFLPSCKLDDHKNKISHLQTDFNDENVSSVISNLHLNSYPDEHSYKDKETKSLLGVKTINNNSK